jgi:hypothetical protein
VSGANDLDAFRPKLRSFIADPTEPIEDEPERIKIAPLDLTDPILELAPEAYLDSRVPTKEELRDRLDAQVRDNIAALVALDLQGKSAAVDSIVDTSIGESPAASSFPTRYPQFGEYELDSLFKLVAGDYHSLNELGEGDVPVASCADGNNGIAGRYEVPKESSYADAITIAFNGSPLTTKLHPYPFGAKDDVAVAMPLEIDGKPLPVEALIFIQSQLNSERWRFSYYRKCFRAKLGRTIVELPEKRRGILDVDFMVAAVRSQPYWWFLAPRLRNWATKASAAASLSATDKSNPETVKTGTKKQRTRKDQGRQTT